MRRPFFAPDLYRLCIGAVSGVYHEPLRRVNYCICGVYGRIFQLSRGFCKKFNFCWHRSYTNDAVSEMFVARGGEDKRAETRDKTFSWLRE